MKWTNQKCFLMFNIYLNIILNCNICTKLRLLSLIILFLHQAKYDITNVIHSNNRRDPMEHYLKASRWYRFINQNAKKLRRLYLWEYAPSWYFVLWFQKSGSITYNGHTFDEFCIRRTSAYTSQTDNHIAELTVRETLDFAARCQGANEGFAGLFLQLLFILPNRFN